MFADIVPTAHQFPQQQENSNLEIVQNVGYHFGHCLNVYHIPRDARRAIQQPYMCADGVVYM